MNSKKCTKNDFPTLGTHYTFPADIIHLNHENNITFIPIQDLQTKFSAIISEEDYINVKHIIKSTLQQHKSTLEKISLHQPFLPSILKIFYLNNSGCSRWTKLLKHKNRTNSSQVRLELKWEQRLGVRLGPLFWDKCYARNKLIFFDNKLKWLQYQINRGTLKTNHIVSKFKPEVSNTCTFCNDEPETILHLMWDCTLSNSFILQLLSHFNSFWPNIPINVSKIKFIFGDTNLDPAVPFNFLTLHLKRYIWIARCNKSTLREMDFIAWFRNEISTTKSAFQKIIKFRYLQLPLLDFEAR